jgi:hypothetical protein
MHTNFGGETAWKERWMASNVLIPPFKEFRLVA